MRKRLLFFALLGTICTRSTTTAAIAGALEEFPAIENAESWSVFDYADENIYFPEWNDVSDPFIYLFHAGDAGLWFFTDEIGNPAWIGNYAAESIQAIEAEIYVDSLRNLDFIDCAIWTDGPEGSGYYYSEPFTSENFSENGWWNLRFPLEADWFYFEDRWIPVEFAPEHLENVSEIGFRFFPRPGTSRELLAGVGSIRLEPLLITPELTLSQDDHHFRIEFQPPPGTISSIKKLFPDSSERWQIVPGETKIEGSESYQFTTPLDENSGIFRVETEAHYQQILFD